MNTSQFMDKQVMDLTNSQTNNAFFDLINPKEGHIGSGSEEEIMPNYDFHPIRPITTSQKSTSDSTNLVESRVRNSGEAKTGSIGFAVENHSSLGPIQPANVSLDKEHNAVNAALLSEIDSTMKRHTDNLLHALEGLGARITQMESRTRHLENLMDDLKVSFEDNEGSTNGKLRQLEDILREVQADVQVITDKQVKVDSPLHLEKIKESLLEQQSETCNDAPSNCFHLPPASQQHSPPSVPLPNQISPNAIPSVPRGESYFTPNQTQVATNQEYQLPPPQPLQPLVPALQQPPPPPQYLQPPPPPHPQYSQPPPQPLQNSSLSTVKPPQPPLQHHPDGAPYAPPSYPPTMPQPPPPSASSPFQQFYGPTMHEPPNRPNSVYPTSYGASYGPDRPPYPYGGSVKQQQLSSAPASVGESGYGQLPTARTLPHALPTASGIGAGSASGGTSIKVPADDVVDKITSMGFSRDLVRATVKKLTENGQSVDLNVVLDKLMNDGHEGQPPRGWFGR